MRGHRRLVGAAVAVTLMVGGCGTGTATPTGGIKASTTPAQTPASTPASTAGATESATAGATSADVSTPAPTAVPAGTPLPTLPVNGFYLRAWSIAPIGMEDTFGVAPKVISDGKLLTVTFPPFSDTYPLYVQPASRTISAAGLTTIVAEAQSDGLLGKSAAFVCPHSADAGMVAGSGTDHLVLIVGGVSHEMTSSCPYAAPAPATGKPTPATWAAFERFKKLLADPSAWLGSAVGPSTAYNPDRLAVLANVYDPVAASITPVGVTHWPLSAPLAAFGVDLFGARCGVVSGKDATTLLPVVKAAPAASTFRDDSGTYADLVVRAFMPGEPNPCVGY